MIIESIMNLFKTMITGVFGILPNIPSLPEMQNTLDSVFDLIFSNATLLNLFINVNTIKICVPILLVIWNFDKIYDISMWILKKIPFFGIQ